MERESPDLVVLAGDIGNPSMHFEKCLRCFLALDCTVAVLPGNHDIWTGLGETSIALYEEILPDITESLGFHWLEKSPLTLSNQLAICGSIGWYDYSAREPSYQQSDEDIVERKARYAADAVRVDWEYTDPQFARIRRERLIKQLADIEANDEVQKTLVVTHVPIFEGQLERNPDDENWSFGIPYFGHLTLGEQLMQFGKVRWVVSGHTHLGLSSEIGRNGLEPIATSVVPSDYGKPRWVTLDV